MLTKIEFLEFTRSSLASQYLDRTFLASSPAIYGPIITHFLETLTRNPGGMGT